MGLNLSQTLKEHEENIEIGKIKDQLDAADKETEVNRNKFQE